MDTNTATTGVSTASRVVEVLNAELDWRIERNPEGKFDLYDEFGYSGTFASQALAYRHFINPNVSC